MVASFAKNRAIGVTGIDFEWPGLLETDVLADSFLYNNFDQPWRSSAAMGATSVRINSPIILGGCVMIIADPTSGARHTRRRRVRRGIVTSFQMTPRFAAAWIQYGYA